MTPPLRIYYAGEGEKVVPTDAMIEAGALSICEGQYGHMRVDDGLRLCAKEAYAAMSSAAPPAKFLEVTEEFRMELYRAAAMANGWGEVCIKRALDYHKDEDGKRDLEWWADIKKTVDTTLALLSTKLRGEAG